MLRLGIVAEFQIARKIVGKNFCDAEFQMTSLSFKSTNAAGGGGYMWEEKYKLTIYIRNIICNALYYY